MLFSFFFFLPRTYCICYPCKNPNNSLFSGLTSLVRECQVDKSVNVFTCKTWVGGFELREWNNMLLRWCLPRTTCTCSLHHLISDFTTSLVTANRLLGLFTVQTSGLQAFLIRSQKSKGIKTCADANASLIQLTRIQRPVFVSVQWRNVHDTCFTSGHAPSEPRLTLSSISRPDDKINLTA